MSVTKRLLESRLTSQRIAEVVRDHLLDEPRTTHGDLFKAVRRTLHPDMGISFEQFEAAVKREEKEKSVLQASGGLVHKDDPDFADYVAERNAAVAARLARRKYGASGRRRARRRRVLRA